MSSTSKLVSRKIKGKHSLSDASNAVVMIKGSVEKLQRPLDVIRGLPLTEAMSFLYFSAYAASKPIAKLLKSAAANAANNNGVTDLTSLYVSKIWAVKSIKFKRFKAGPRGKARPIEKSHSRVFVELGVKL